MPPIKIDNLILIIIDFFTKKNKILLILIINKYV